VILALEVLRSFMLKDKIQGYATIKGICSMERNERKLYIGKSVIKFEVNLKP
jgi:hypothetical protein